MSNRFPRLGMLAPLALVFFLSLVLMRAAFWLYFLHGVEAGAATLWQAFGIGVRFDLRLALLLVLPLALLSFLPGPLNLRHRVGRGLGLGVMGALTAATVFFYMVDFAHYSYLAERVNVSVLRFLEDGRDTWQMVWESYPLVWLVLGLAGVTTLYVLLIRRVVDRYRATEARPVHWRYAAAALLVVPGFVFGVMGKVGSTVPLRWSDALFSGNPEVNALGLNPVMFFFDTLGSGQPTHDPQLLRQHYAQVAEWLGVDRPDPDTLSFTRRVAGRERGGQRPPNVVFIHLESLGANRMGVFGNPLGATPNIDRAAREGIFFPNFMVPSSGTARTVFGLITGVPDVTWGGSTATRNPLIADQYTLVNAFEGYRRLYFLGGSAGWANVKGLLQHSIEDLELWEEGSYDAPNVDVWGISDRSLFTAAHRRLAELPADEPFVAFIQTAGNHRPFTIPDEDSDFEVEKRDEAEVKRHSFLGLDQYNAVRLLDHNIGYYLYQLVPGSHYADNTIFLLYGDHNDRSEPSSHMGYSESLFLDKHHVPFIIFGPGVVDGPRVMEEPASLVDLLPTALGIAGLPYVNRTLGRDLLAWDKPGYALTFGGDRSNRPLIGLLGSDYHFRMFHDGDSPQLFPLDRPRPDNDVAAQQPEIAAERQALLHGLYQSARYLLEHNSQRAAELERVAGDSSER